MLRAGKRKRAVAATDATRTTRAEPLLFQPTVHQSIS